MSRHIKTLADLVLQLAASLQKSADEVLEDIAELIRTETVPEISAESLQKYNKLSSGMLHALYALLYGTPSGGNKKRMELILFVHRAVVQKPTDVALRENLKKLPLSKVRDLVGKLVKDREESYQLSMGKDRRKMATAIINGFRSLKLS